MNNFRAYFTKNGREAATLICKNEKIAKDFAKKMGFKYKGFSYADPLYLIKNLNNLKPVFEKSYPGCPEDDYSLRRSPFFNGDVNG
jgi:hypothetical protein